MEIHEAVVLDNFRLVRKLLQNGISVASLDQSGRTPLHWAITLNLEEIAQTLLVNTSPRHLKLSDRHGCTVLHYAAACGRLDLVRILIDRGLPVDTCDKFMRTPLHLASECGHLNVVSLLLEKGANPCSKDSQGRCPSDLAFRLQHPEVVKTLVGRMTNECLYKLGIGDRHPASQENLDPNRMANSPKDIKHLPGTRTKKFDLDALLGEWKHEANRSKQAKAVPKSQKLKDALALWKKSEESIRLKSRESPSLPSPPTATGPTSPVDHWIPVSFGPLEGDSFKQQSIQSTIIQPSVPKEIHGENSADVASIFRPIDSWEDIYTSSPFLDSPKSGSQADTFSNMRREESKPALESSVSASNLVSRPNHPSLVDPFYSSTLMSLCSVGEDFHWCTEWESTKKRDELELRKMEKIAKAWENRMLDRMQHRIHSLKNMSVRKG